MKISDIRTELFTQCTITDFGVRFVSFSEEKWKEKGSPEDMKSVFTITVNLLKDGRVMIVTSVNNVLTAQQIDEIQRISKILRSEV